MRSFLGVPIRFRGKNLGNIYLANKRDADEFSLHDEEFVRALAERTAVALQTARLYRDEAAAHVWLESILDQMPDAVIVTDAAGHVTVRNRSLGGLLSGENVGDEGGGSALSRLCQPSGVPLSMEELPTARVLKNCDSINGEEVAFRRPNGELVPVLVSAAPIRSRDGRITGAVMMLRDITQLKEVETRRQEWASVVAHDLRHPLTIISLSTRTLERGCPRDDAVIPIERIRASVRQLDTMIDDLLDAAILESRQLKLRKDSVDIVDLIQSFLARAGESFPRVEVSVPRGGSAFVWADSTRIEQVLTNLLRNAAKYGDPNHPVTIATTNNEREVEVRVTNRGRGIPAEELHDLFGRFTRTRQARAGRIGGLGLGLYICKGLIEAHGGKIWVESVPDATTSFFFTLPKTIESRPATATRPDR
jgi:signal transduction histidine kinase